jgi:DNA-binding CsgD family transcriptional regulator/tetratricopeptide (TPR) repeat protein
MELIERAGFINILQSQFNDLANGEGHCVFVTGEAGIGKTSLIKTFCKELPDEANVYLGYCDALFTPRPLAPLYDIMLQMGNDVPQIGSDIDNRTTFFTRFYQELNNQKGPILIIFEDIHWADEATLDFIKFLARRISLVRCLFILTYRDNEIHSRHPLRTVLGQLNPASFSRIQLPPLTLEAVDKLAREKGFNGENVYSISGGNPFYVNEILAGYSTGVPDNIKDSILSVYNRLDENTKHIWELLSAMPTGFEIHELEKLEPLFGGSIENCLDTKILIVEKGRIFFKHELYRRTVESSLSPLLRIALHKKILSALMENFEVKGKIEQIIHHAKNANDYDLVIKHAPGAAMKAACVGAHEEAARLYLSAIEYYQGSDAELLIRIYEGYAYECYLTNQIKEAIVYTGRALNLWKKKNDSEKVGNALRFLSRLWWFDGNRKQAESFAKEAIDVLETQPSSSAKAMAYSNMSQLKMLSDEPEECNYWGGKAIAIGNELHDEEILSHAFNNIGDVQARVKSTSKDGLQLLQQSLAIALKNSYHEHAARAYTNLAHNGMLIRDYAFAGEILEAGIHYCEERDLDSWTIYMRSSKSRMYLDTGRWNDACRIANDLLANESHPSIVKIAALVVVATIRMRKGELDPLPMLAEANEKAFETMELQRMIPALVASLEYEWITGSRFIKDETIELAIQMVKKMGNVYENSEFAYWLKKARDINVGLQEFYEGYQVRDPLEARKAAGIWERSGCPYQHALALYEGSDEDKKRAITIIHDLGAQSVYEKLKLEMRSSGIKSIPRGMRKSTQSNPASLTGRELDVLQLLNQGLQNKEIAASLFISAKTVDHHISAILFKLEVNSRIKAVQEAIRLEIIK